MGVIALLAAAVALASPPAHTSERAVALLSDNRLIELALPSGRSSCVDGDLRARAGCPLSGHRSRRGADLRIRRSPRQRTGGADWLDVSGATFLRCEASGHEVRLPRRGPWDDRALRRGLDRLDGGESLVQYGQHGNVLRRLHTGLRRDHLMDFAFNVDRSRLYVLSSCLYGRDGLRRVSLSGVLRGW